MKRTFAALFAACVLAMPAGAADGPSAISPLASAVSKTVIAPGFAELGKAFAAQAAAWDGGCSETADLRAAYHGAADAWAHVEFFRTGPLSQQTRAERIDYWPDPRNATEKGLKALLAAPAAPTPQTIADASVAAQGLPALERLLFPEGQSAPRLDDRTCDVGRAIAHNLESLGRALDEAWNAQPSGELHRLEGESHDTAKSREAAVAILTELATGLRVIEERKLPPLVGANGGANPKAAKFWRSARSTRDVAQNLAALGKAYAQIAVYAPQAAASVQEKLMEAAAALDAPENANRAIAIQAGINNARYYAVDVLPAELGVTLGFNSLDGD